MLLKPNTQLKHGEYRIDAVLGQGGFGITYLATQVALNRKVAIKEFFMKEFCERNADTSHVTLGTSGSREIVERFRAKFIKEAQHIAQLNHPHIVRIYDVFEANGTAYYVMEYHDGGSLADRVKQGPLPEAAAVDFVRQVAEALGYLHSRKMNHLDVKPGNILLDEEQRAVLIDFGLSKRYDEAGHQTSTTPVGISHGYAPMEQYRPGGVGTFSPATDIYSLGATLYRLTTGQTPPDAGEVDEQGLPALPATLSAATRTAIVQAMQPRRKDRPQSVEAFCALLNGKEVAAETVLDITVDEETHLDEIKQKLTPPLVKNEEKSVPTTPTPPAPKKQGGKKWLWTVVILLLVAGGFWGGRSAMTHLREQQAIADSIALAEAERLAREEAARQAAARASRGTINGHEWVDLGLSVKWATCNVGASSLSAYGNYYAWGETRTKSEYNYSNSVTYEKSMGDIAGSSQYDAARANWGSSWRLPTKAEFQELINNCTWTWTSQGGHNGYKVTGKNGNSIFLPAAGWRYGSSLYYAGENSASIGVLRPSRVVRSTRTTCTSSVVIAV